MTSVPPSYRYVARWRPEKHLEDVQPAMQLGLCTELVNEI